MTRIRKKCVPKDRLREFHVRLKQEASSGILWVEYGDFLDAYFDDPESVVRAYENAAMILPNSAGVRVRLGSALVKSGQFQNGISIIKDGIKQKPTAPSYCLLAEAYISNNLSNEALKACENALELEPTFEEAYYLMGEAVKSSSSRKAIVAYRKAIALDSNYQLAWQALGRELVGSPKTILEGIAALRMAVHIDSEDGWARIYLANSLWRIGHLKRADYQFKAAIKAFPECEEFRRWYAQFKTAIGK
jgi:tetratricopeptide (TPR) repeat protein